MMSIQIKGGRSLFLAGAFAGLFLAGCNTSDDSRNPSGPSETQTGSGTNVKNPGGSGMLGEPLIPTAEQIKAIEELSKSQKIPVDMPQDVGPVMAQKSSAADFTLNFNDFTALSFLPDHAYASFAPFYIQKVVGNAWVYAMPMKYSHFHLGFENPVFCFGSIPGKFGVMSGGTCVQTQSDAASVPRNLAPHDQTEKVQVYVWDGSRKYTFDFKSFYLPPTSNTSYGHVQVWIHKIDVGWRYWADLGSATNGFTWNLPQTGVGGAQGIDEIQITSPGSFGWTIDNLVLGNVR
jgi:hypothetical protein